MISVTFRASAKGDLVGPVANPSVVAFRGTKVLPSACASVRDLAGCPATAETYMSTPTFHSSLFDPRIKSRNSVINSRKTASLISRGAGEIDRISSLSRYMEELVTGPGGLLSRGLLEHHATSYGALPANKTRARISRRDP